MSRAICWLRRDLRLEDQRTLAHATSHHDEVILAFVFDTTILQHLDSKNRRVTFIIESLRELDQKLRQLGSRVLVLHGDPIQEIPRISRLLQADEVICGKDYDPLAIRRDLAVQEELDLSWSKIKSSSRLAKFARKVTHHFESLRLTRSVG